MVTARLKKGTTQPFRLANSVFTAEIHGQPLTMILSVFIKVTVITTSSFQGPLTSPSTMSSCSTGNQDSLSVWSRQSSVDLDKHSSSLTVIPSTMRWDRDDGEEGW